MLTKILLNQPFGYFF